MVIALCPSFLAHCTVPGRASAIVALLNHIKLLEGVEIPEIGSKVVEKE